MRLYGYNPSLYFAHHTHSIISGSVAAFSTIALREGAVSTCWTISPFVFLVDSKLSTAHHYHRHGSANGEIKGLYLSKLAIHQISLENKA